MTKNPYSFPAKSRKAMLTTLADIGGYSGYNAPYHARWPFAWNVKIPYIPGNVFAAATLQPDNQDAEQPFNSAWDNDFESDSQDDLIVIDDMARHYVEGCYCTYPGDDQGDYIFTFGGRSGGHLILKSWQGRNLRNFDLAELDDLAFADLRKFYRAVMTMDQDFTRQKIAAEYVYQWAFQRMLWEDSRRDEIRSTENLWLDTKRDTDTMQRAANALPDGAERNAVQRVADSLAVSAISHKTKADRLTAGVDCEADELESVC